MKRSSIIVSALLVFGLGVFAARPAFAAFVGLFVADLSGYEEVPSLSTPGNGWFVAWVDGDAIRYRLFYDDLATEVHQAHIHFGQKGVNAGVSAFLCSNLDETSAGTPECPPAPATVRGTITAEDVVGPSAQGIAPGELDELIAAIKAGATYVNVHTEERPGGEIRGQIRRGSSRR